MLTEEKKTLLKIELENVHQKWHSVTLEFVKNCFGSMRRSFVFSLSLFLSFVYGQAIIQELEKYFFVNFEEAKLCYNNPT